MLYREHTQAVITSRLCLSCLDQSLDEPHRFLYSVYMLRQKQFFRVWQNLGKDNQEHNKIQNVFKVFVLMHFIYNFKAIPDLLQLTCTNALEFQLGRGCYILSYCIIAALILQKII